MKNENNSISQLQKSEANKLFNESLKSIKGGKRVHDGENNSGCQTCKKTCSMCVGGGQK